MKHTSIQLPLAAILLLGIYSCKKGEITHTEPETYSTTDSISFQTKDPVSSVATMKVKDKQFIKTAKINMEVKDVYESTISIEKLIQELGGFVTKSNLQANIISENTYNTSNDNAMLVKKFQTENTIQVRIPNDKLGEFLNLINGSKLFLHSRIINAEDVTSSIKYAELEEKRIQKTSENISQLKTNKDKVQLDNENKLERNQQQFSNMEVANNIKYSTVDIYIKEPKIRIAEISIINTKRIEDKYKTNFIYNAQSAFLEGYYLIQKIIVGLMTIWPLLVIGAAIIFFYRKRKSIKK